MFFPIIGQRLVEFTVFLLGNIIWITSPDGLFLFVFVGLILVLIFANIFNFGFFWIIFLLILVHFVFFSFIIRNFLVAFFLNQKFDGIANELGMFLDDFLDSLFFVIVGLIFFQMQNNLGASSQRFRSVSLDGERAPSRGFPNVLLVIIVLRMHNDFVGYQVSGIETYTKLTDHGNVGSSLKSFHESLGTGLGNGTPH